MDEDHSGCCTVSLLAAIILILIPGITIGNFTSIQQVRGTIVDTKIDNGSTYFVFLEDGSGQSELLTNHDNWLLLKFDSGNYLMNLRTNQHYDLKVNWVRFPPFSWYRNILTYEMTPAAPK